MSSATLPETSGEVTSGNSPLPSINRARLFIASCFSLIATAVAFAVVGDSMGALKGEFVLNNGEVGLIGGAAIWGFTISMFALGPFCDVIGMKRLMWFAFLCHSLGVIVMVMAPAGFVGLFMGALIISLGNGTVEAACNPLVATLYPDRKTEKLNQFHVWFPGGIVIGGLVAFALSKVGEDGMDWRFKIGAILVPTIVYGILLLGQNFPKTERAESGVSFGEMLKATVTRPLFIVLFICMGLTASMELGPNRWVPAVLAAGGISGILVLVWINGLMAVLRFFAGPIVHRLSPTGILVISSVLAGIGLLMLSYATTTVFAFVAGTVFALGVCFFWPTMLGVTAERVPKGGEFALALMGGMGMAAVGLITAPAMGTVADRYALEEIPAEETTALLQQARIELPALIEQADPDRVPDYESFQQSVENVLAEVVEGSDQMPEGTANTLRQASQVFPDIPLKEELGGILNTADNYGGRISFRYVAPISIILLLVFGAIYLIDLKKGGYKAESINS